MKILFPDPKEMVNLGQAKLAYVPFYIDEDGGYPREANQYLRERSLAEWQPRLGQSGIPSGNIIIATRESREAIARNLNQFFAMCNRTNPPLDWRVVSYDDLLDWQTGLLDGTNSTSGKELSNGYVQNLIHESIYFLTWAATREYREAFNVLLNEGRVRRSSGRHTNSGKVVTIDKRVGSLTPKPDFSMLPTDKEMETWLRQVYTLRGPVKGLCCEVILRVGLRITECVELLRDDIPKKVDGAWPSYIIKDNCIRVTVHRGNKGPKKSPGSLESTRPRDVWLPIDLAERIDHYIHNIRPTLIHRAINRISDKERRAQRLRMAKPKHLWVGEFSGLPFTAGNLRTIWGNVPSCPVHWSPHRGREWFAVDTMVRYAEDLLKARGIYLTGGVMGLGWLDGLMSTQVRVILTPIMGHVSEETTQIYLRRIKHRLVEVFGHPAIRWAEFCSEEGDDLGEG